MTQHPALFRFDTFPAAALRAVSGANEGDAIGTGDAAVPGDVYRLARGAAAARLAIADDPAAGPCVADGSRVGLPGTPIVIEGCAMFMGPDGRPVEVLLLDLGGREDAAARLVLPLARLREDADYELLACDADGGPDRLADVASVSFIAGTRLSMADGRQVPVEELKAGDTLLTRLHGPRAIRWIGRQTYRATGAAAPVRIAAGTLNAARDLRLSPQHRLFIWQREDATGAGRAEVLVRAGLLVNGTTVTREEGGHVDSYQLLFEGHEVVFAEGIAVEGMLVTGPALGRLPEGIDPAALREDQRGAAELEIDAERLGPDAAERLSRASRGEPG
ncbi:Hint domain-containing protein [Roseibacterium sp. SDUM158017]|uniref:Hint domain-containing protein n=1 Tax=Roseicyclus salinarum TaxID=3036773 RepID=UPI0024151E5F|nr:Hint domain-containing protein [Roseibacterium sp. SDUM158017]MDG4649292.1 Hint domain-containing protein [Roseibacterium sp. SDUM158017]